MNRNSLSLSKFLSFWLTVESGVANILVPGMFFMTKCFTLRLFSLQANSEWIGACELKKGEEKW